MRHIERPRIGEGGKSGGDTIEKTRDTREIREIEKEKETSVVNKIAGRINKFVDEMGGPCPICEKGFTPEYYRGKCKGYSWSITYFSDGEWDFSLTHHTKEIWWTRARGGVADILLTAYEGLLTGEWKKKEKIDEEEKIEEEGSS